MKIDECKDGKHDLIVIYSAGDGMESNVVRWCRECGSVVVDVDSDGQTYPGLHTPMQTPNYLRRH